MEKYTVVVRQKRLLFWWVRDNAQNPIFCETYGLACATSEHYNDSRRASKSNVRYIVISIDEV